MENNILISVFSGIIAFVITIILINRLIPILKKQNFVNNDLNKKDSPLIPEMGGIGVVFAFFVAINFSLYWVASDDYQFTAMVLFTIMGVAFVGILDDLLDLRQHTKSILPFIIAVPFGIGLSDISITMPGFGSIPLGWVAILLVPLGITTITNLTNMLEGFNGLGVGLGIIITVTLIIVSFITGQHEGLFLLIPLLGALLGFFYFNRYPSKIFPGDTLMFFQGATIGCAAILGNMKTFAAIIYLPLLIEFILKARGGFPTKNHGNIMEDGTLTYDEKVYSLSHLVMKYSKVSEKRLVAILWLLEGILCAVMILIVSLSGPEYAW